MALGLVLPTSCVRLGTCKECVVEVTEGMTCLSPPTPEEHHLPQGFRLACRTRIAAESGSVRFRTMRRGAVRIERRAFRPALGGGPVALEPCVTREGPRVLLDSDVIARAGGPLHGLALDVGTTVVAVRLFDLESGDLVAETSFENPQRFGGPDAIARLHYDFHHPGKLLQRTLVGYLVHALAGFRVDPRTIYEVVVAGNPAMRDLFFRRDGRAIARSASAARTGPERDAGRRRATSLAASARGLRLPVHPRARVYGLPTVGGPVGADVAACMLAVGLAHEERIVALMVLGASTELIVGNRRRIVAASCPGWPALEGGRVGDMPALPGAIDDVRILADGTARSTVVGGGRVQGICAAGLVAAVAELRRTGRIDERGRFEDGGSELILAEGGGRRTAVLERDVGELARAKGAAAAALRALCGLLGTRFGEVEVFYLAGGFGDRLDLASARRIGLVPDVDDARLRRVDDAALEGASLALLSRTRRDELEGLVERVECRRLETDPAFSDHFAAGCLLRPMRQEDP